MPILRFSRLILLLGQSQLTTWNMFWTLLDAFRSRSAHSPLPRSRTPLLGPSPPSGKPYSDMLWQGSALSPNLELLHSHGTELTEADQPLEPSGAALQRNAAIERDAPSPESPRQHWVPAVDLALETLRRIP